MNGSINYLIKCSSMPGRCSDVKNECVLAIMEDKRSDKQSIVAVGNLMDNLKKGILGQNSSQDTWDSRTVHNF